MLGSRSPFTRPLSRDSVQRELAEFEQTLTQCEAADADGSATRAARTRLARAYRILGRPADALALGERNLAACERLLAADDPETLAARSDLARDLVAAGRGQEAIDMLKQVRADTERVLGPDQPASVLAGLDLIEARVSQRDRVRVEEAAEALATAERVFGPDHLDTMYARAAFSTVCLRAGRTGDAVEAAQQNLASAERVLGPDDLAADSCRVSLGWCYVRAGRSAAALPLLTQADAKLSGVLGTDSAYAHNARVFMAIAHVNAGQPAAAVPLLTEALARNERLFDPAHRTVIAARRTLAAAYLAAGRAAEAIPLLEQALADIASAMGAQHPDTLAVRAELAAALAKAGRTTESVDLYKHVIAERTRTLGADDKATLAAKKALAGVRSGSLASARPNSLLAMTGTTGRSRKPLTARRLADGAANVLLLVALLADIRLGALHVTGKVSSVVPVLRFGVVVAAVAAAGLLAATLLGASRSARRSLATYAGLPADAAEHMSLTAIRDSYVAEQTARYGAESAGLALKYDRERARVLRAGGLFQLAQPVLMAAFAVLYHGKLAPFIELYLPIELLLAGLVLALRKALQETLKQIHDKRRAVLGVDAAAMRSMPGSPAKYVAWCTARGIDPYPHGRPPHPPPANADDGFSAAPEPA
jgi:tetratricopeptide (TPR) repeat protein